MGMISRRKRALIQILLMTGLLATAFGHARSQRVHLVEQAPVAISKIAPGVFLVDFGRVAFGNLSLGPANSAASETVTVRFGEALKDGRVDTHPPGSVRYSEVKVRTVPVSRRDCRSSGECAQHHTSRSVDPGGLGSVDALSLGRGGRLAI